MDRRKKLRDEHFRLDLRDAAREQNERDAELASHFANLDNDEDEYFFRFIDDFEEAMLDYYDNPYEDDFRLDDYHEDSFRLTSE